MQCLNPVYISCFYTKCPHLSFTHHQFVVLSLFHSEFTHVQHSEALSSLHFEVFKLMVSNTYLNSCCYTRNVWHITCLLCTHKSRDVLPLLLPPTEPPVPSSPLFYTSNIISGDGANWGSPYLCDIQSGGEAS